MKNRRLVRKWKKQTEKKRAKAHLIQCVNKNICPRCKGVLRVLEFPWWYILFGGRDRLAFCSYCGFKYKGRDTGQTM